MCHRCLTCDLPRRCLTGRHFPLPLEALVAPPPVATDGRGGSLSARNSVTSRWVRVWCLQLFVPAAAVAGTQTVSPIALVIVHCLFFWSLVVD